MRPYPPRYVFLLVSLTMVALYWTSRHSADEQETASQPAPVRAATAVRPAKPQTTPTKIVPDPHYPLAERVDRLAATGRPADAYDAYWLVQTCIDFQRTGDLAMPDGDYMRKANDVEMAAEKQACASLTERMKTARLEHLTLAAKAGVDGADLAFLQTGPFGDSSALTSRPDDPLVRAWKEEAVDYLEIQARQGRVPSMITLVGEYHEDSELSKKHPAMMLRYATAVHDYFDAQFGGPTRDYQNPLNDEVMKEMAEGLTPEQIKLATADGKQLAARVAAKLH